MIGVDLAKDEVILNKRTEDITTSYLIIQKADMVDSGKYTCAPSNAAPTSIIVHVLQGKCSWFDGSKWLVGGRRAVELFRAMTVSASLRNGSKCTFMERQTRLRV